MIQWKTNLENIFLIMLIFLLQTGMKGWSIKNFQEYIYYFKFCEGG